MRFRGDGRQRLHLRHLAVGLGHDAAGVHDRAGTPYGLAAAPVIKVATRSELARRWKDLSSIRRGPDRDRRMTIGKPAGTCSS